MENFFNQTFGSSEIIFSYILLPLLIFLARITDVSINTIRIIYVLGGRRWIATILGFFESFIWLMAIRQIFAHVDNWVGYLAYPAGFATGIYVGMIIEEKIAYGKVIVRIITRKNINLLIEFLTTSQHRYTVIKGHGADGEENVVFTVIDRNRLEELLEKMKDVIPSAFFTIEKVNRAIEGYPIHQEPGESGFISWLNTIRRK